MRIVVSFLGVILTIGVIHPAFALTQAECDEIFQRFGFHAEDCPAASRAEKSRGSEKPEFGAAAQSNAAFDGDSVTQVQRQNNIFFLRGGVEIDDATDDQIEALGRILNSQIMKTSCLQLVGHSDASGPEDINVRVSEQRAQVVAQRLSDLINPARIESVLGIGESQMLPNVKPGNAYQRRVEIRARRCE